MNVRETLTREALRCVDHLKTVEPSSHEFGITLENMERIAAIRQFIAECFDDEEPNEPTEPNKPNEQPDAPTPKVVKLDPIEEVHPVSPAPVFEETNEPTPFDGAEKVYTKEEVRAALGAARSAGVNVTELMKRFGVDKFPAFPAGRYGELMAMLEGMMT